MKQSFKIFNHFIPIFLIFLISGLKVTNQTIPTFDEVQIALKEVAYSYYMRGKFIQYNSLKVNWFSPEEATSQNINYLVCSGFTRNVYRELLNITIPQSTMTLLTYAKNNLGSPEVIAYSHINNNTR